MKFRKDFVTNSSSSSFVCEVCGIVESGWDMCIDEAGMVECECGHEFCVDHLKNQEEKIVKYFIENLIKKNKYFDIKTYIGEDKEIDDPIAFILENEDIMDDILEDFEYKYNIPKECCPLCNHDYVRKSEIINFAANKLNMSIEELTELTRKYLKDN